jgi:hypothetical protein
MPLIDRKTLGSQIVLRNNKRRITFQVFNFKNNVKSLRADPDILMIGAGIENGNTEIMNLKSDVYIPLARETANSNLLILNTILINSKYHNWLIIISTGSIEIFDSNLNIIIKSHTLHKPDGSPVGALYHEGTGYVISFSNS